MANRLCVGARPLRARYGPSIWLVGNSDSHELLETHDTLFAPVNWVRSKSPAFESALTWYIRLWLPQEPGVPDP
jgi:hypothetical protein